MTMKKNLKIEKKEAEALGQLLFLIPNKDENTFFNFKDVREISTILFEDAINQSEKEDIKIKL